MSNKYIDFDTLKFMLYEVHGLEKMLNKKRFEEYDKETIDMFLESIKDFSDRELFPVFKEMDEKPAYYKDGKHRIDYIDGANLVANNSIEQVILDGNARAYGLEVLLRKNQGAFQGWIAYTLSKSEQKTSPRNENEIGINNGQWYNTPYDKPHDLSIYGTYTISERWKINGNFIYQTGLPTNYPIGQFDFQGVVVPYYGLRNEQRLPDYHRRDL